MREGYRFKLIRPVDRFSDFVASVGLTGTVEVISADGDIWATMDHHIPGAEHWDNQIHWGAIAEFLQDSEALT